MTGSLHTKGKSYYAVVRLPDETGVERQKWIPTGVKVNGNNKKEAIVGQFNIATGENSFQ